MLRNDPRAGSSTPFDPGERTERLGPYRLLDPLGEGGMGEVWHAEQLEPVRREVAIKILKLGMDTRDVIARFEAERQLLAIMDHPNIAKIYDGGVTGSGRPYFAMELVRGVPITVYCDAQRLLLRKRLRMFVDVCRAVQHAHQKGVIHRDLKPSNVLITVSTAGPVVKVIDFGIAKAVGGQWLTDKTLHTRAGQMLGTPAYMSPEQAETSGIDIDTRSDIYSLGAMLYELLIGTLAFDPRPGTPLEFAIRERDIPRPSARLRTLDTREIIAKYRHTTSEQLRRELRGDLDWIVLRCMEKDRTRRYDTANGLALDIERYLKDEPVSARPPNAAYRFRKFARRHRAGIAAAGIALLALVGGAAAATAGFVRARHSEALQRQEAATARQVSEFLVSLFAANNPSEARGNAVTARELLDRGSTRIRAELRGQPQIRLSLLRTMGRAYASLGLFEPAEFLMHEALLAARELGRDSLHSVPFALRDLAGIVSSRGRYSEADSLLRVAIAIQAHSGTEPDTMGAMLIVSLAFVQIAAGQARSADTLLRAALKVQERALGSSSRTVAGTLASLAFLHDDDPAFAEPLLRRAFAIESRARGADHPYVLGLANNIGVMLAGMARFDDAEQLHEQVAKDQERVLGAEHPSLGITLMNIGFARLGDRRPLAAIPVLERSIRLVSASGKGDSARVGFALQYLGRAHLALGSLDSAETLFLRALTMLERSVGPRHNYTATTRIGLGLLYTKKKRLAEAEVALRQATQDQEHNWGPVHRRLVEPLTALAAVYAVQSRRAEADSAYRRALQVAEVALVPDHPDIATVRLQYAALLRSDGRARQADSLVRRATVAAPR